MQNSQSSKGIGANLPFSISSVYPHLPEDERMMPMEGRGKYDVYPGDLVGKLHKEQPVYGRVIGQAHKGQVLKVRWANGGETLEEKNELVNSTLHADAFVNEDNAKKVVRSILYLWSLNFSLCAFGPIATILPGDFVSKVHEGFPLYGRVVAGNSKKRSFSVVWSNGDREKATGHSLIQSTQQSSAIILRCNERSIIDGLVWLKELKVQRWSRKTVKRVLARKKTKKRPPQKR